MDTTPATVPGATPEEPASAAGPIVLTPKAVEMVKATIAQEKLEGCGLRIAVVGGGCSGYQYGLDLEKEARPDDAVYEQDGVKMFVDPMSGMYLAGVTIDYQEGVYGSGFSFQNPNAKHTCGCGSSFTA